MDADSDRRQVLERCRPIVAFALLVGAGDPRAIGLGVIGARFRPSTLLITSFLSLIARLPLTRGLTTCMSAALAAMLFDDHSFVLCALAAPPTVGCRMV